MRCKSATVTKVLQSLAAPVPTNGLRLAASLLGLGVAVVIATHERDLASLVDRRIESADGAIRADERREAVR